MKKVLFSCILCFLANIMLAQNSLLELMRQREEYVFSFIYNENINLNEISRFVSIDKMEDNTVYCYANPRGFEQFQSLGIDYQLVRPSSLAQEFDMIDVDDVRATMTWDAYPTYAKYEEMMQDFAEEYPQKCSFLDLGTVSGGHKIMVARINNGDPTRKPKVLLSSTMHGDECTGYVLMLRLIDSLLTTTSPRVQNLVDSLDIFICPNANPDGTYYSSNNNVYGARRYNKKNIDLNRNYPDYRFGTHPDGENYGEETEIFMRLADEYPFSLAFNYHGGAEVFNYPWDNSSQRHADDGWWQNLGKQYVAASHKFDRYYMTDLNNGITNGNDWYQISGSRQDWMNYYKSCREVTIEISSTKTPSASDLPYFWNGNRESILLFLEEALNGFHGVVTDSLTGEPIEATITLVGHDKDYSKVRSTADGDFHRMVKAGTYMLLVEADGYNSKKVVAKINDGQRIDFEFQLVEEGYSIEDVDNQYVEIFPNPVGEYLNISLSQNIDEVNIKIFDIKGNEILQKTYLSPEKNLKIDMKNFTSGLYFVEIRSENFVETKKIVVK